MEISKFLDSYSIVLYDGECGFCNSSILFILDRKPDKKIKFLSQQSDYGIEIKKRYNIRKDQLDTILFVENGTMFIKAKAVLKILAHLKTPWKLLSLFQIIPSFLSNLIYDFIAENRYGFSDSNKECRFLSKEQQEYFL